MKNLLFIFLLFSSSLFALEKSATVLLNDVSSISYTWDVSNDANGNRLQDCQDKSAVFRGYDIYSNPYTSGGHDTQCASSNPDSDKLKIKSIVNHTTYSIDPECDGYFYHNPPADGETLSYHSIYHENVEVQCTYKCKYVPQPSDSPDAVWNDETCSWEVPCTIPDTFHVVKSLGTTDMTACQNEVSNLESLYPNFQGHLQCYGCPDTQGQTLLDIYQDITTNDSCPAGTTSFGIQKDGATVTICDTDSNNDGVPDSTEPKCPDGQFMDINGTCQSLSLPDDFPKDSDDKGHAFIRSDGNFNSADCVPGAVFHTGIAFAKIIGWNSETNKCEIGAFFCNDGFTWDNMQKTCVAPADNLSFDPNKGEISQELADACSSGNWAKKWTLDYCGQPLCYIALNDQNYNLRCGNKYLEYDCTSDYRIKKYVQVSCGEPAREDLDNHTIDLGGSTSDGSGTVDNNTSDGSGSGTNDYLPDLNSSANNIDIVSAINSASGGISNSITSLDNHVLGLKSNLGSIDGKMSDISSAVGSINGALHTGDDKLGVLDGATNEDGTGFIDGFFDDVQNSYDTVKTNFDDTSALLNSGFQYTPPANGCYDPSTTVEGKTIKLNICEPLAKFRPIVYFIMMLVFTFLGIKIFILGLAI